MLHLLAADIPFRVKMLFQRCGIHERVICCCAFFLKELWLKSSINFGLERNCHVLIQLLLFHIFSFSVVILSQPLFHLQMVANLQLIFNQVLCLGKCPDKLISLLLPQSAQFRFLDHMRHFQLFFFLNQLILPVTQLIPEHFFLKIEASKNLQILLNFVGLFFLNDPLDFPCFLDFLAQESLLFQTLPDRLLADS